MNNLEPHTLSTHLQRALMLMLTTRLLNTQLTLPNFPKKHSQDISPLDKDRVVLFLQIKDNFKLLSQKPRMVLLIQL